MKIPPAERHRIADHQAVIAKRGSVVLGKIGRPASKEFTDPINQQIAHKIDTLLFLATRTKEGGQYVLYKCRLRQMYHDLPTAKRELVPSYYGKNPAALMETWFELASMDAIDLNDAGDLISASGKELDRVLRSSAKLCRVHYA
jgi:hypothetical protein